MSASTSRGSTPPGPANQITITTAGTAQRAAAKHRHGPWFRGVSGEWTCAVCLTSRPGPPAPVDVPAALTITTAGTALEHQHGPWERDASGNLVCAVCLARAGETAAAPSGPATNRHGPWFRGHGREWTCAVCLESRPAPTNTSDELPWCSAATPHVEKEWSRLELLVRAYRHLCGLRPVLMSMAEQRAHVELVREMGRALGDER